MMELYFLLTTIVLLVVMLLLHKLLYRRIKKQTSLLTSEKREIDYYWSSISESRYRLKKGIEAYLTGLDGQKKSIEGLVLELTEVERTLDRDDLQNSREVVRALRVNKQLLDSIKKTIVDLENWYFINNGHHYIMSNDIQFYQDPLRKNSMN